MKAHVFEESEIWEERNQRGRSSFGTGLRKAAFFPSRRNCEELHKERSRIALRGL